MTFIAVQCSHCQSEHIVKRGQTHRGTQRYLCQHIACTQGSCLLDDCHRGCLPAVKHWIVAAWESGNTRHRASVGFRLVRDPVP